MTAPRHETEQPELTVAPARQEQPAQPVTERHGYRPSSSNRLVGLGGTALIYALALAGFFFTVSHVVPVKPPSALTVFNIKAAASPPEAPPKPKEAPRPVEKKEKQPEPPKVQPVEHPIIPLPTISTPPAPVTKPADSAPPQPETAAPKTAPAPPAPQVSSNAPDTWEGRVLAQLNKHRQYPRAAMARRQQGVPYIRFVMDRDGKVLSSRLERSSGFPDLDREAVALPRRASPLPKPPDDKPGDTLELVVPVEFFLTRQ